MANGVVFYSGPSRIDGRPIVGIATWGSENVKTGPLIQTWILAADVHPAEAVRSGADASICGSCPLRGLIDPARGGRSRRCDDTRNPLVE